MKKGFTLLEVIIAIFIITIGVLGAFVLITQTISYTSFSSNRLVAAYLAQEGIEIVRNIRDTNWLEQRNTPTLPWDDGLGIGDWEGDYDDTQNLISWVDPGNFLNINANDFYSYSAGAQTKFKRKITITPGTDGSFGDFLNVSVQVDWQEKGKPYSLSAQENLYNWK